MGYGEKRRTSTIREMPLPISSEYSKLIMEGKIIEYREPIVAYSKRLVPPHRNPQMAQELEQDENGSWNFMSTVVKREYGEARRMSDRRFIVNMIPPLGCIGDLIWCREPAYMRKDDDRVCFPDGAMLTKDGEYLPSPMWEEKDNQNLMKSGWKLTQGVHVPRWGTRILLEVFSVYPERLKAICEDSVVNMGITSMAGFDPGLSLETSFIAHWDAEQRSKQKRVDILTYDRNPLVWVYNFKMIRPRLKKKVG